ncbi:MAG: hypothetical protein IJP95_03910 [Bacteroidales bacterium]|nr:hypothetical protein [Bacteroidales bacterium]
MRRPQTKGAGSARFRSRGGKDDEYIASKSGNIQCTLGWWPVVQRRVKDDVYIVSIIVVHGSDK